PIKSPGVRHQAVRADSRTGVVRVVQIWQSEGVADLVADHANSGNGRATRFPEGGLGVIAGNLDLHAIGISVAAGPRRRKEPFVRPDIIAATCSPFRSIARV